MASSYKLEKKLMDEKIAKVREVVRSVSSNDIILALHNFDLDVERTIQAFCEVGAKGALGDWENTGIASKKKQKNKKPQQDGPSSTSSSTPLSQTPLPPANGKLPTAHSFSSASEASLLVNEATNGYVNGYLENNNGTSKNKKTIAAGSSSVPATSAAKPKPPLNTTHINGTAKDLSKIDRLSEADQQNAITNEVSELRSYHAELDKAHNNFDKEIAIAQSNMALCFKEIRQALLERERQLHEELSHCRQEGDNYFSGRRNEIRRLQQSAENVFKLDEVHRRHLLEELKTFTFRKQYDSDVGHATRFVYDNTKIVRALSTFGEVVPVKFASSNTSIPHSAETSYQNADAPIKHSTSHSSLVSSIGEDSGLGQISPVSQAKSVAQVDTVASNSLSENELAEINRRMQELLKMQGIDPSVLDVIQSSAPVPQRRRPPPKRETPKGGAGKPTNSGKGKNANQKNKVDLSIFE